MRTFIFGVALCGIALTGATSAQAAEPVPQPEQGRIGMALSHEETAALADGPVPALVSRVVPLNRVGAGLRPDSQLERDTSGGVHASLRQVLAESATHRNGHVVVFLDAPGSHGPRVLDVYERWN